MTKQELDALSNEQLVSLLAELDIVVPSSVERWQMIDMLMGECSECQQETSSGNKIDLILNVKVKNIKYPGVTAKMNNRPNAKKKQCSNCGKN